jgi:hypothetical protein
MYRKNEMKTSDHIYHRGIWYNVWIPTIQAYIITCCSLCLFTGLLWKASNQKLLIKTISIIYTDTLAFKNLDITCLFIFTTVEFDSMSGFLQSKLTSLHAVPSVSSLSFYQKHKITNTEWKNLYMHFRDINCSTYSKL